MKALNKYVEWSARAFFAIITVFLVYAPDHASILKYGFLYIGAAVVWSAHVFTVRVMLAEPPARGSVHHDA